MTVELQTGNQVDVTSSSDAELYAGFAGGGSYVIREPLQIKLEDSNTLSVGSGNVLQNGRHIRLKGSTDFTIPSGIQAQKRSHIAVIRTTITRDDGTMETLEKSEPLVLSGEPVMDGTPEDPAWIEGNLLAGDTIADFPLARVVTDGINALEPEPLYDVMASAAEFQAAEKERWDSIFRIASGSHKGTCVADSIIGFDVPLDIPDGYRIASITRLSNTSAGALVPSDVTVSSTVVSILLRNTTAIAQPFTLYVMAVCAKAELFA